MPINEPRVVHQLLKPVFICQIDTHLHICRALRKQRDLIIHRSSTMNYLLKSVVALCILHVTVAEEILYAKVGADVQIDLSVDSDVYLHWFFNNEPIASLNTYGRPDISSPVWKDRLTISHTQLVIKNITHFGTFTCTVKKKFTIIETKHYKVIQLTVTATSQILLPGQRLSLTCDVATQTNRPQIVWKNPQGGTESQGISFTTEAAHSLHSGQWMCVLTNPQNKVTRSKINVTVIDLLPVAPIPTQYTSKSSPLSIPCTIASNISWEDVKTKGVQEVGWDFCPNSATSPTCSKSSLFKLSLEDKLTWKPLKDTTLQPVRNLDKGNLSLGRTLGRKEDSGDYVCFMKFPQNVILKRTIHVEVLQIIASPRTVLTSGQQLNLTCTTGHPLPTDLRVKWIPPRKEPSLHYSFIHDHQSPHLTIPEVGWDDRGMWKCELWRGETLLTSAVVELNIEPRISNWMLATIGAAAVILILLVILIVILHRRRQRRTRRHRLRLCKCKNPKPKGFYRS